VHFYQLTTGAIWASEEPITFLTKRKQFRGKCYKVKSMTANPEKDIEFHVIFPKKALACAWYIPKPDEGGQLFGKENPNLHPKDKKKHGKV
jgi:hypothetical protein